MSTKYYKKMYVPYCAIPIISQINETIVNAKRRGVTPQITLPGMIDRAFYIVYETGLMPLTSQDSDQKAGGA
jgi:hypothetical protein